MHRVREDVTPGRLSGDLSAADDTRFWVLAWLLLETGLRIGEAIVLTWTDVDLARGVLRVERSLTRGRDNRRLVGEGAKTASSVREVALSSFCVAALRRLRGGFFGGGEEFVADCEPELAAKLGNTTINKAGRRHRGQLARAVGPRTGEVVAAVGDGEFDGAGKHVVSPWGKGTAFVFPGRGGRLWNEQTPRRWLQRRAAALGLPVLRTHDLRHTNATLMRSLGIPEDVRAWRLGHRQAGQTAVYTHPSVEQQRAAAEAIGRALAGESAPKLTPPRRGPKATREKRPQRGGKSGPLRRAR